MGVSPAGGSSGRGSITGGGDLHLLPPEHSRTVHCDQAHYGFMSGAGAEDRVKVRQAVVGAGWLGLGRGLGGGSGGGMD